MNQDFVLRQIRKYGRVSRVTQKDAILTAIGIHVGLLEKKNVVIRELTVEQRDRVLYFVKQFCLTQGLEFEVR
ncbi:MAG TPA: hypothetical protein DCE56_29520 [Cyanobacteria bacterium UBA8553]|nr:hypothetical protein [Cyanobacteria bacterium UBA8553]